VDLISAIVGALIGLLLGAGAILLTLRPKLAKLETEMGLANQAAEAARTDLARRTEELQAVQIQGAALKERVRQADAMMAKLAQLETDLRAEADMRLQRETEIARLTSTQEERERSFEEQKQGLLEAKQALEDRFKALSEEILKQNTTEMVRQAEELLKRFKDNADGDLKVRQEAIKETMEPFQLRLKQLEELNRSLDENRTKDKTEITEQIRQMNDLYGDLNKNTTRLVTALRDPGTAGNWGELALQRVLEIAGLAEHVDYETQVHIPGEDKNSRPDVIVTLPGERRIVIDAKTPLDAYLQAMEVNDEQQRRALLVTFAEKVMGHGKALAKRDYGKSVEGLELVGLFLPSESAYRAALDVRPNLVEDMLALNIMLISPQNSLGFLRAVAFGWKQDRLAKEAKEVHNAASQLYDSIQVLIGHYLDMGKGLNTAVKAYNNMEGNLRTRLIPRVRKMAELGAEHAKEIAEPTLVQDPVEASFQLPEVLSKSLPAPTSEGEGLFAVVSEEPREPEA
jgi:DNA recombination protein RmuC